ncbi:MAG: hypothetical protein A3J69_01885 [Candidatus Levybacteria bacterium RIFCSPHIGHO2_02_FULL_42_12]|nr:MAG: hypothetical protein A2698_01335 [Candidatus Levybacteria bacterium RIFCSPHIGHO2_01_FULL_42_15]OGH33949.1 MAG: hypothetical protein A3J69_01885 [Candidatus Levybacteria bacterium RIFCSPHIGHO2_02_FULL_42_12]OGH42884.1 MAG: hypothetical protein A3B53_02450 [Candidatus Levybacteria bacterium RIFCSPLOWO2_01_FULL_42_15]
MKNPYLVAFGIILIIVIPFGVFFAINRTQKSPLPNSSSQSSEDTQEEILPLNPDELNLIFEARRDKKAVKFSIGNTKGITSIEYEISYLADGEIPRGAIGQIEVNPSERSVATNYIDLGTCSSGRCKYDEGVTSVKLILKIIKTDGKIYSAEKELEL